MVKAPKIEHIRFMFNVIQATGVRLSLDAQYDLKINSIKIHWPPGCLGLVDVRCGHGIAQCLPSRESLYLNLDNVTPEFHFKDEEVGGSEPLWTEINNRDGGNDHNITVVMEVERLE